MISEGLKINSSLTELNLGRERKKRKKEQREEKRKYYKKDEQITDFVQKEQ